MSNKALRYYNADGSYEVLDSPEAVVERRIAAARRLESLQTQLDEALSELRNARAELDYREYARIHDGTPMGLYAAATYNYAESNSTVWRYTLQVVSAGGEFRSLVSGVTS